MTFVYYSILIPLGIFVSRPYSLGISLAYKDPTFFCISSITCLLLMQEHHWAHSECRPACSRQSVWRAIRREPQTDSFGFTGQGLGPRLRLLCVFCFPQNSLYCLSLTDVLSDALLNYLSFAAKDFNSYFFKVPSNMLGSIFGPFALKLAAVVLKLCLDYVTNTSLPLRTAR